MVTSPWLTDFDVWQMRELDRWVRMTPGVNEFLLKQGD